MNIKELGRESFRTKFLDCYDKYLNLSNDQSIAIGIYQKGYYYVFGNGINIDYMYDIGSISKTFAAHLTLKYVSNGFIKLDDTVDKYLNLKKGSYPTINELLTHSAGYNNLTPVEFTVPSLLKHGYSRKNIYEKIKSNDVVKALQKRRRHKDKNKYGYSDFAFAILAVVLESVTKVPFAKLLENFIKEDLEMLQTKIIHNENRFPYAVNNKKIIKYWNWNEDNPYLFSGGIVSNIQDMLKYINIQVESEEAYIKNAHVLSEEIESYNNIRICKGWHTYQKSHQLWHVGGGGTFRSSIIVNKHRKNGVIVLGNTKGIKKANIHYLAKMIYSELKIKKIIL